MQEEGWFGKQGSSKMRDTHSIKNALYTQRPSSTVTGKRKLFGRSYRVNIHTTAAMAM